MSENCCDYSEKSIKKEKKSDVSSFNARILHNYGFFKIKRYSNATFYYMMNTKNTRISLWQTSLISNKNVSNLNLK